MARRRLRLGGGFGIYGAPRPHHFRADLGGVDCRTAEGRLVGRNIFLDGNTFSDSHSASKKPLVGDVEIGFTVSWDIPPPISVTYRHLVRTPEFDGQRGIDNVDSLSIAMSF